MTKDEKFKLGVEKIERENQKSFDNRKKDGDWRTNLFQYCLFTGEENNRGSKMKFEINPDTLPLKITKQIYALHEHVFGKKE